MSACHPGVSDGCLPLIGRVTPVGVGKCPCCQGGGPSLPTLPMGKVTLSVASLAVMDGAKNAGFTCHFVGRGGREAPLVPSVSMLS